MHPNKSDHTHLTKRSGYAKINELSQEREREKYGAKLSEKRRELKKLLKKGLTNAKRCDILNELPETATKIFENPLDKPMRLC